MKALVSKSRSEKKAIGKRCKTLTRKKPTKASVLVNGRGEEQTEKTMHGVLGVTLTADP
jgi:hypothetical protein